MANSEQLQEDLLSAEIAHGGVQQFWRFVDRADDLLFFELTAIDGAKYMIRLDCTGYGDEPIDGKFVEPSSRACVARAWPNGNSTFEQWVKFKDPHLFICWDQDRTGIARHPDWRPRKAWTKETNPLFHYLDFMRALLHLQNRGYLPRPS